MATSDKGEIAPPVYTSVNLVGEMRELKNGEIVARLKDWLEGVDIDTLIATVISRIVESYIDDGQLRAPSFAFTMSADEQMKLASTPSSEKRVTVRLPAELNETFSDVAGRLGMKKSDLLRLAISGRPLDLDDMQPLRASRHHEPRPVSGGEDQRRDLIDQIISI